MNIRMKSVSKVLFAILLTKSNKTKTYFSFKLKYYLHNSIQDFNDIWMLFDYYYLKVVVTIYVTKVS